MRLALDWRGAMVTYRFHVDSCIIYRRAYLAPNTSQKTSKYKRNTSWKQKKRGKKLQKEKTICEIISTHLSCRLWETRKTKISLCSTAYTRTLCACHKRWCVLPRVCMRFGSKALAIGRTQISIRHRTIDKTASIKNWRSSVEWKERERKKKHWTTGWLAHDWNWHPGDPAAFNQTQIN